MKTKKLINIFIVEDNKTVAAALKADIASSFAVFPMKIQTFETGEKCMEKFKEEKPQIVILDYHLDSRTLGAANGVKVLDWIKKENNETQVIMLTMDDNIDIALKSFKHGASDYIVKSDTQFRKIIFSLFNLIKLMRAKEDALRYKYMTFGIIVSVVVLILVVIYIQIIDPWMLKS